MKQFTFLTAVVMTFVVVTITSCGNKRTPGKIYMPDMAYSRAYETYAQRDSALFTSDPTDLGHKIFFNNQPVAGTNKRSGNFPYSLPYDSNEYKMKYTLPNDSNGYKMSATVKNPLGPLSHIDSLEASRLFNINCAICHGAKGTANGPLSSKIGAIANLTLPLYVSMADGTMFHSIQYGKNNMGSYASQLNSKQRWMIIQYIRTLQPKAAAPGVAPAKSDSVAVKKA